MGRSRERGRKRVPREGPPTCSLQPTVLLYTIISNLSYQDHSLCDWRTSSCAANGYMQTSHVSCGESCPALGRCSMRYTWTRRRGANRLLECLSLGQSSSVRDPASNTYICDYVPPSRLGRRVWCRQCNLSPRAAHLPKGNGKGPVQATRCSPRNQQTNTSPDARPCFFTLHFLLSTWK